MTEEKYGEYMSVALEVRSLAESCKFQLTSPAEDRLSDAVCGLSTIVMKMLDEMRSNDKVRGRPPGECDTEK